MLLPLLVAESQAGMALGHALGRLEGETNSRMSRRPLTEISGGKPIAPEAATGIAPEAARGISEF